MALVFDTLSVRLGTITALRGVSGAVQPGRITAILGPNGAGKSTLLACLAGLRIPDTGAITLDGQSLAALTPLQRARQIGFLPQRGQVHWDVRVEALVALGRLPFRGRWGERPEDRAAITAAMQAARCAHLANRGALSLSGGEQARVLLARVLAGQPRWLLADEPLAHLDPAHQLDALEVFQQCARAGAGVALVLHDLALAARVADDVLMLHAGEVLASGPLTQALTPASIAAAFGVEASVTSDEAGLTRVTLLGRHRA